jgi:hypothetical protein
MPCTSPGADDDWRHEQVVKNEMIKATLCGIMSKHGVKILKDLDWKEMGVEIKDVLMWWQQHRRDDIARKAREKIEKAAAKAREKVLSKLSRKEKALLNLDD